jgi:hypothetical protein
MLNNALRVTLVKFRVSRRLLHKVQWNSIEYTKLIAD